MTPIRVSRLVLAGVVAAAVATPVAAAARSDLVQIGGRLVAPSQLSSVELGLENSESTRLVQIGGELVRPSQLSAWQSQAAGAPPIIRIASSSSSSFSWRDAGAGAGAGAVAVLLLGSAAVVIHRRRPATV